MPKKSKLVDMQLPKPRKNKSNAMPVEIDSDKYPWGLRLDLNEQTIKKLKGIMKFEANDEVYIVAKADIIRVSTSKVQSQSGGDKLDRSMELQITDLAITGDAATEFQSSFDEE